MKPLLAIAVILLAGILGVSFNNSDMSFRQTGTIDTTPVRRLPTGFTMAPGHTADLLAPLFYALYYLDLPNGEQEEAVQSLTRCYPKLKAAN